MGGSKSSTLHFSIGEGDSVSSISMPSGSDLASLPIPTTSHTLYYFVGWYGVENPAQGDSPCTSHHFGDQDTTLYAKWGLVSDLLNFELTGNEYTVTGCKEGFSFSDFHIPFTYEGKAVTKIADEAFKSNTIVKDVYIPDSITTIGNSIFDSCPALRTVTIPYSVQTIDNAATNTLFDNCNSLESIFVTKSGTASGISLYLPSDSDRGAAFTSASWENESLDPYGSSDNEKVVLDCEQESYLEWETEDDVFSYFVRWQKGVPSAIAYLYNDTATELTVTDLTVPQQVHGVVVRGYMDDGQNLPNVTAITCYNSAETLWIGSDFVDGDTGKGKLETVMIKPSEYPSPNGLAVEYEDYDERCIGFFSVENPSITDMPVTYVPSGE